MPGPVLASTSTPHSPRLLRQRRHLQSASVPRTLVPSLPSSTPVHQLPTGPLLGGQTHRPLHWVPPVTTCPTVPHPARGKGGPCLGVRVWASRPRPAQNTQALTLTPTLASRSSKCSDTDPTHPALGNIRPDPMCWPTPLSPQDPKGLSLSSLALAAHAPYPVGKALPQHAFPSLHCQSSYTPPALHLLSLISCSPTPLQPVNDSCKPIMSPQGSQGPPPTARAGHSAPACPPHGSMWYGGAPALGCELGDCPSHLCCWVLGVQPSRTI